MRQKSNVLILSPVNLVPVQCPFMSIRIMLSMAFVSHLILPFWIGSFSKG